jgi:hypothetical protein
VTLTHRGEAAVWEVFFKTVGGRDAAVELTRT